jgi:hypothetical protein
MSCRGEDDDVRRHKTATLMPEMAAGVNASGVGVVGVATARESEARGRAQRKFDDEFVVFRTRKWWILTRLSMVAWLVLWRFPFPAAAGSLPGRQRRFRRLFLALFSVEKKKADVFSPATLQVR